MLKKISIIWLLGSIGLSCTIYFLGQDRLPDSIKNFAHPVCLYGLITLIASLVAFLQFGWDKYQAKNNGWRVPEKTLLLAALVCGWPGATLGQQLFRHKTTKQPFGKQLIAISLLHLLLPVALLIGWLTGLLG